MDMGLVHCVVWLFTSQLLLILIAPTHEGMAWMAGYIPRWLTHLQMVTHLSTNRTRRWLTSLMRPTTLRLSQTATFRRAETVHCSSYLEVCFCVFFRLGCSSSSGSSSSSSGCLWHSWCVGAGSGGSRPSTKLSTFKAITIDSYRATISQVSLL